MEGTDKKVTGNTAVGAAECRVFDAKVWANVVVISRGAEVKAETAGVFAVEV